ncbi:hypothetical protein ABE426_11250 [Sphingobacterium faecium]|uniref:foldase protein PrsA n=1 Tax=Sphingobacterium faecium TaxID=34087 RepID=UPI003208D370
MKLIIKTAAYLLLLFLYSCSHRFSKKEDHRVVLQVGTYTLLQDEYYYLKEKLKRNHQDSIQLLEEIRDQAYLLAFANEHRYDTINELNKRLDYALKFYIAQVDGYLWNKKVKPKLQLTDSLLQTAYKKSAFLYQIDLIKFSDKDTSTLQKSMFDQNQFNNLKKITSKGQFHQITLTYPFLPYGVFTTQLDQAKINDIIGPFKTDEGVYVMMVKNIVPAPLQPYKDIEQKLRQAITIRMTNKYVYESVKHIQAETKPKFYDQAITDLCRHYDQKEKKWSSKVDSMLLMEYTFHGNTKQFKGKDFKEFIQYQPMFFGSLQNTEDVKKMINTHLISLFLYNEAQKLSPENDSEYLLFKGWLRNRFYINYFREHVILPHIQPQQKAVQSNFKMQNDSLQQQFLIKKEKEEYRKQIERLKTNYKLVVDKMT